MSKREDATFTALQDVLFIALRPIIAKNLTESSFPHKEVSLEDISLDTELEIVGHARELIGIVVDIESLFDIRIPERVVWIPPYQKSKEYGADCVTVRQLIERAATLLVHSRSEPHKLR